MKRFIFIETKTPNKNGHVTHVMYCDEKSNDYIEVSPRTGQRLQRGLWLSNLDGYKVINPLVESYCITGSLINRFAEFLLDNPEHLILK